jgi:hypothetical protein
MDVSIAQGTPASNNEKYIHSWFRYFIEAQTKPPIHLCALCDVGLWRSTFGIWAHAHVCVTSVGFIFRNPLISAVQNLLLQTMPFVHPFLYLGHQSGRLNGKSNELCQAIFVSTRVVWGTKRTVP